MANNQRTIGIALSGAGYRAALFGLGGLWRLNDAGLLNRLDCISSVSGAAIAAGMLARHWSRLVFDGERATNFADVIALPLLDFCATSLAAANGDALQAHYSSALFGDFTLDRLPTGDAGPGFVFTATHLSTGSSLRMRQDRIADPQLGHAPAHGIPLALVVAASSAPPQWARPVNLRTDPEIWSGRDGSAADAIRRDIQLCDGCLCDTLALDPFIHRTNIVLVCDGSASPALRNPAQEEGHATRVPELLISQARALRRSSLLAEFGASHRQGAYWSIGSRIEDMGTGPSLTEDDRHSRALLSVHNRLDPISQADQASLINWGYAMCDAALRSSGGVPVEAASTWPVAGGALRLSPPRSARDPTAGNAASGVDQVSHQNTAAPQPVAIRKTLAAARAVWPVNDRVMDETSLGIVVIDLQRDVLFANKAGCDMMGIADYRGLNLHAVFIDEQSRATLAQQLEFRRAGWVGNYSLTATRLDNKRQVPLEVTALPIREGASEVVGTLAIFRSLQQLHLTLEIHRLNRDVAGPNELLKRVAEQLQAVQPMDMMIVSRYSDDQRHSNSYFIFGHSGSAAFLQKRWVPLTEAQSRWSANPSTSIFDLDALMDDSVWRSFRLEPFAQELRRAGYSTVVRRPVFRLGKLKGAVALLRRKPTFDRTAIQLLEELPVDAAVLRSIELLDEQRMTNMLQLVRDLNRCTTVRAACKTLAERLVRLYGWAHVSIFRIDRSAEMMFMVAQHCMTREMQIKLPDDYKQPMTVGLLGRVVRERSVVNVGDIGNDDDYIRGEISGNAASELACPVFFDSDGERAVRFIVNVEDEGKDAFSSDECTSLVELAGEIGSVLQRIGQVHFLTQCFERTGSPIFVTDNSLTIKKTNMAGALLIGKDNARDVGGTLSALLADADADYRLRADTSGELGMFELRQLDDVRVDRAGPDETDVDTVPVLIFKERFREELEGFIFVMRDLTEIRRTVALELFQKVAYEVAVETSTPLAMAMAEVQKIMDVQEVNDDVLDRCTRVLRRLSRVKQSYTRLALFNTDARRLPTETTTLDVAAEIDAIIAGLGEFDQGNIEVVEVGPRRLVRGDHFQFGMVIDTLLAVLVRFLPEEERVEASIVVASDFPDADDWVTIRLTGRLPANVASVGPSDIARLRADLFIAWPLLASFMNNMGGRIEQETLNDGRCAFVLQLPALPELQHSVGAAHEEHFAGL